MGVPRHIIVSPFAPWYEPRWRDHDYGSTCRLCHAWWPLSGMADMDGMCWDCGEKQARLNDHAPRALARENYE